MCVTGSRSKTDSNAIGVRSQRLEHSLVPGEDTASRLMYRTESSLQRSALNHVIENLGEACNQRIYAICHF